jgi:hypothetical protein
MYGKPHQIHLVEDDPERADGALEQGGEGNVKRKSLFNQDAAGAMSLIDPGGGKVNVRPTGESILSVPYAFTVPQQNEFVYGADSDQ